MAPQALPTPGGPQPIQMASTQPIQAAGQPNEGGTEAPIENPQADIPEVPEEG